jgi:hypothetical protein
MAGLENSGNRETTTEENNNSESPAETLSLLHPASRRQNRVLNRLGFYTLAGLVGGTVFLLGCVAFLAVLWLGDETNKLWRLVVLSGWVTRSITIAAFAIRLVASVQAGIATSMMAAIMLRSSQTRLTSAPAVGMAQFANTGPLSLLPHILHSRRVLGTSSLVWAAFLGITVSSMALQLSSTALLSDIGRGLVKDTLHLTNNSYALTYGLLTDTNATMF